MGKAYANLISIGDCVYAEAARFAHLQQPFTSRDIDAIFIASDWNRPEKNYALVRRIASACADLTFHIVGRHDSDAVPARYHGVVTQRDALYALLGRAKAIVCPSRFDPAPGVLFEASAMGCNVVTSPNSGNWELCHEQLLARSPAAFAACTRLATTAPFADHRDRFRGGYHDLVDTLTAFM
jgi:glycosyltransferase involved in cell wall biosynthesis